MQGQSENGVDADISKKITQWIESHVGGKVVIVQRQARWRPMYAVDVTKGGQTLPLLVRGERVDSPLIFPLKHEMLAQKLMYEQGIPVPKVYGWCDDPACFVMERVPGVPHFEGLDEETRRTLMRDYIQVLAQLHKLPVEPFKRAGVIHAKSVAESHLLGAQRFEQMYRSTKKRPDPFLEFVLGWLKRNPLTPPQRESLITWDSGQLHQVDGHLVSMIDVELAHIGDPMMDLAAFRMRDSVIGFGDFTELYQWYEEFSGVPVDMDAIKHHHLFFTLTNALAFHVSLADPTPSSDYMTNLQWVNETNRYALDALGEFLGLDLPEIEMPRPEETVVAVPFEHMVNTLRSMQTTDPFVQYELRRLFRLSRHLQRWDQVGRAIVECNLDDIGKLVGKRPQSWQQGQIELESFVVANDGGKDIELMEFFNRYLQRQQSLNGPPGSAIARHNPIQGFNR